MSLVNLYISYRLIKLLSSPYTDWKAYKLGLIDETGEIIKDAKTPEEKDSFSMFEKVILKIKKIITKFTGQSRAMAVLSTLALIKEDTIRNELYKHLSQDVLLEVNMPSNIIKSFAKKSGKPEKEVERLWDKAKVIVQQEYPDKEDEEFFGLVTGTLKNMLKLNEETVTGDVPVVDKSMEIKKREPDGCHHGIHYFDVDYENCNIGKMLDGKEKYKPWRLYVKDGGIKNWANSNFKSFDLRMPNGVHVRAR